MKIFFDVTEAIRGYNQDSRVRWSKLLWIRLFQPLQFCDGERFDVAPVVLREDRFHDF